MLSTGTASHNFFNEDDDINIGETLTDFNEGFVDQEQIGESTDIFSPPAYEEFGPDLEAYEEFAPNEDDGINSIDRVFKRFNRT